MKKRITKIAFPLVALLMVAMLPVAPAASAQTTSPYSMYGYGLLNDRATSMQRQMGGVGVAMNSGRQINVMNPASYAAVDSLTFLFDLGADVTMLWQKDGDAKSYSTGGGLDYVTMQFPIWKYMGASVGLIPVSSVGYAFGSDIKNGTRQNQGSGGINELYFGFAGGYAGFTLGANISYDFGNIINDIYNYPSTTGEALFERVMLIRDWNILIGAQYSARFARDHKLTFGVTYQPEKTFLGKTYATLQETNADSEAETLTDGEISMRGKYTQPTAIGGGINYTYQGNTQFSIEADIHWANWSKAKFAPLIGKNGETLSTGLEFADRTRYAIGGEVIPKVRGNYGQRMTYRLGAYTSQDYLMIHGNHVRELGVTAGLGLPTPEGKTLINVGFEWKKRMTTPTNLLSENYFNVTVGVNFNEVWFWKRKIR